MPVQVRLPALKQVFKHTVFFIPIFREFSKKGKRRMDYVIRNHKNLYIKLNENGVPVTCSDHEKGIFEYSKATNIAKSLKKSLKKLNFKVEPLPEITPQINKEVISIFKRKVIGSSDYQVSENVTRWIDRFGSCYDALKDAEQTLKNLVVELETCDNELLDILHIIELEPPKDLYGGWQIYKAIRGNRKRRRNIKDETLIINNVLEEIKPDCLDRERIKRAIDGLIGRKYNFRVIEEEDDTENVM